MLKLKIFCVLPIMLHSVSNTLCLGSKGNSTVEATIVNSTFSGSSTEAQEAIRPQNKNTITIETSGFDTQDTWEQDIKGINKDLLVLRHNEESVKMTSQMIQQTQQLSHCPKCQKESFSPLLSTEKLNVCAGCVGEEILNRSTKQQDPQNIQYRSLFEIIESLKMGNYDFTRNNKSPSYVRAVWFRQPNAKTSYPLSDVLSHWVEPLAQCMIYDRFTFEYHNDPQYEEAIYRTGVKYGMSFVSEEAFSQFKTVVPKVWKYCNDILPKRLKCNTIKWREIRKKFEQQFELLAKPLLPIYECLLMRLEMATGKVLLYSPTECKINRYQYLYFDGKDKRHYRCLPTGVPDYYPSRFLTYMDSALGSGILLMWQVFFFQRTKEFFVFLRNNWLESEGLVATCLDVIDKLLECTFATLTQKCPDPKSFDSANSKLHIPLFGDFLWKKSRHEYGMRNGIQTLYQQWYLYTRPMLQTFLQAIIDAKRKTYFKHMQINKRIKKLEKDKNFKKYLSIMTKVSQGNDIETQNNKNVVDEKEDVKNNKDKEVLIKTNVEDTKDQELITTNEIKKNVTTDKTIKEDDKITNEIRHHRKKRRKK